MRSLPLPVRDLAREQLSIALEVNQRNGQQHGYRVGGDEIEAVIALYDAYDAVCGAPSDQLKGLDLDGALRAAIQKGYDFIQAGRRLALIRQNLMHGIERCPICGISAPRVLDHHLPKAIYHPLAIYARNLVPLCGECNLLKGAIASAEPAEQLIHPYFGELPQDTFLRAAVNVVDNGLIAEFGLDPAVELPDLLVARLNHQLGRLRLNERYAKELNSHLTNHTTALSMCFDAKGSGGVRDFLIRQASVEFERFHANHWSPILLVALADHADFCGGAFRDVLPAVPAEPRILQARATAGV